jgi:hypothetical protein
MGEALLAPHLRLFALAVLLAFLGWVVRLIRTHRLSLRESLLWFLSTGAAMVVTLFPSVLVWLAGVLQVEVPSNALFALTFVYVLVNLLALTLAVSTSTSRVRRLTQECALLRAELEQPRRELAPGPGRARRSTDERAP